MPRDGLVRMEVDTHWVYHRKWRQVQREHPQDWPVIAVGWFTLLGEAWRSQSRDVTLADAWPATLDITVLDIAVPALQAAGLLDRAGKLPRASWQEWIGPTLARVEAGRKAAAARWGSDRISAPNATALPSDAGAMPIGSRDRESSKGGRGVRGEGGPSRRPRQGGAPTRAGDVAAAMGFDPSTYPDGTPRKPA